ncbi:MAG: glutamate racemase [Bacteroidia bacterium]|jgi:glutamate racemase|nr:glutamate racemase [Bacteroidia bacterium]
MQNGPIGVFDSGYGGLTVLKELVQKLPEYDYVYLGDNARAPYGTRSFEAIYEYTLQCVKKLFELGCPLVILACNTASAKALRTIQQKDLPLLQPQNRVLGIIRPTAEVVGQYTQSNHIGVVGTTGTITSESYVLEIGKLFPQLTVTQEACPMWVPLVENNEMNNEGARYFVKQHVNQLLQKDPLIDTLLLGCTHYPLLMPLIEQALPPHVKVLSQGTIVANSLADYLQRHPEMQTRLTQKGERTFLTTDTNEQFNKQGTLFWGAPIVSQQVHVHE